MHDHDLGGPAINDIEYHIVVRTDDAGHHAIYTIDIDGPDLPSHVVCLSQLHAAITADLGHDAAGELRRADPGGVLAGLRVEFVDALARHFTRTDRSHPIGFSASRLVDALDAAGDGR